MKKLAAALIMLLVATAAVACGGTPSKSYVTYDTAGAVNFDFSKKDGGAPQNIKKFEMFSSTWGFVGETTGSIRRSSIKQIPALSEMKSESMRFDLFMGYTGLGYNIARGDNSGLTDEEYQQTMEVIDALIENNVLPSPIYFAVPEYAQVEPSPNGWGDVPDMAKWKEVCKNIAAYMKDQGVVYGLHEIWNEPDFSAFFNGTFEDYVDMYIAGAEGVREANPDAMIGGISAAFAHELANNDVTLPRGKRTNLESFVEKAADADQLPDVITWHYYGREGKIENVPKKEGDIHAFEFSEYREGIMNGIEALQNGTSANINTAYSGLETVQQHLNEFNIYGPATDDIYRTTRMVPAMLDTMDTLLDASDITRVAWAALLAEWQNDLSYDMIDTITLQRYPAYHTLWMYGRLPVDRTAQPALPGGLKTYAGADEGRAGMIAYNGTGAAKSAKVSFTGIPFEKGDVTVYLVDDEHLTYKSVNEPYILATYENVDVNKIAVNIDLKNNAALYVEVNSRDKASDTDVLSGYRPNYLRKDYYYPQRGDNTPYSDIHLNSMTAHVGMNGNATGKTAMSVTLTDLKDVETLALKYDFWGSPVKSEGSALGVKVDYHTAAGYVKSAYYYYGDFSYDMELPFGKGGAADTAASLGTAASGTFDIALSDGAPDGWDGRIMVSYLCKDAGETATAKFII